MVIFVLINKPLFSVLLVFVTPHNDAVCFIDKDMSVAFSRSKITFIRIKNILPTVMIPAFIRINLSRFAIKRTVIIISKVLPPALCERSAVIGFIPMPIKRSMAMAKPIAFANAAVVNLCCAI